MARLGGHADHAERMDGSTAVLERLPEWQPIGRRGLAGRDRRASVYLASDEPALMTGSAFLIDRGMTAR